MSRALKKADATLRQLIDITLRTDLSRMQRTNLETCITVHMHQKEVCSPYLAQDRIFLHIRLNNWPNLELELLLLLFLPHCSASAAAAVNRGAGAQEGQRPL